MAQVNKGERRLIQARVPIQLADAIERLATETGRNKSELLADFAADSLGLPRPSSYLPQPKRRAAQPTNQEAIAYERAS